jgi:transposase
VRLLLTAGQAHDLKAAPNLLDGLKCRHVVADRGYDADALLALIRASGAGSHSFHPQPPHQRTVNRRVYRKRNLVERYFNKISHFRRICEQAHQQLKEELGLDHFEGRSWHGLHRHALMTMIAYAFLQHRRLTKGQRKKRIYGPPPQPTSPTIRQAIVDLLMRPKPQQCPYCRKWIVESPGRARENLLSGNPVDIFSM